MADDDSKTHSGPVYDEDGNTTAIRTVTEHDDGSTERTDREAGPDLTGGNTSAGKVIEKETFVPDE